MVLEVLGSGGFCCGVVWCMCGNIMFVFLFIDVVIVFGVEWEMVVVIFLYGFGDIGYSWVDVFFII